MPTPDSAPPFARHACEPERDQFEMEVRRIRQASGSIHKFAEHAARPDFQAWSSSGVNARHELF